MARSNRSSKATRHEPLTSPSTPWWAILAVSLAIILAYSNSLEGEFVFDDVQAIVENPSIRELWRLGEVLWPGQTSGGTIEGRPLVNLSLAINYWISGLDPGSYHVVNLLLHLASALTLFGLTRQTILLAAARRMSANQPPAGATGLALATALIWGLHPLQTESVTYVVQRAESMVSLFYLLTLYAVVRAETSQHPGRCHLLAIVTCLAGVLTKEVMVTAPVVTWLYLCVLLNGSPRQVLRQRWKLLAGLALTWAPLAVLVASGEGRGGTAGSGDLWQVIHYAAGQLVAVGTYLKLCFWPVPLVFDYGITFTPSNAQIIAWGAVVAPLIVASFGLLWRRSWIGFLGCACFLILSPSSSIVPILTQPMAEHRMYLPLACVVMLVVLVADAAWRRSGSQASWAPGAVLIAAAAALGLQTWVRNLDYRTALSLWQDTIAKQPDNSRAHRQLSQQYFRAGDTESALKHSKLSIEVDPTSHLPPYDRGVVYLQLKDYPRALADFERSVELKPDFAEGWHNCGVALRGLGRNQEALTQFSQALELKPTLKMGYCNRALARWDLGDRQGAGADARQFVQLGGEINEPMRRILAATQ